MHNRELAGRGEQPPPGFFAAPRTSFNGAVSNRKRYASLAVPLEDVKLVGRVFEATVNDVVLAVCLGWAAAAARGAGRRRSTSSLVAMVPVSTRPDGRGRGAGQPDLGDAGVAGHRRRRPRAAARRHLGVGPGGQGAGEAAPGPLRRRPGPAGAAGTDVPRWRVPWPGTRLFDRVRPPFNVTVSSVRGPDVLALLCRAAGWSTMYPVGPMAEGIGVNVTVFSYLDRVYFGMLACRKLLPELTELARPRRRCAGRAGGAVRSTPGGRRRSDGWGPRRRRCAPGAGRRERRRCGPVGEHGPHRLPLLVGRLGCRRCEPEPDGRRRARSPARRSAVAGEPEPLPMLGQLLGGARAGRARAGARAGARARAGAVLPDECLSCSRCRRRRGRRRVGRRARARARVAPARGRGSVGDQCAAGDQAGGERADGQHVAKAESAWIVPFRVRVLRRPIRAGTAERAPPHLWRRRRAT